MKASKTLQEWMVKDKNQVQQITNESDNVEQFKESINKSTDNKFQNEINELKVVNLDIFKIEELYTYLFSNNI